MSLCKSKLTEYTRVNPNVNYGPRVIMVCQYRFIDFKKRPTLVQDAVHMWEQELQGKSLYFPLNSGVNLKLL